MHSFVLQKSKKKKKREDLNFQVSFVSRNPRPRKPVKRNTSYTRFYMQATERSPVGGSTTGRNKGSTVEG